MRLRSRKAPRRSCSTSRHRADPKASNEFSDLLKQLSAGGVAVLMATHDLFRAKESGTRVGIMRHGKLVAVHGTGEFTHADLERIYLEHMHD